jgi:hypothetical protein
LEFNQSPSTAHNINEGFGDFVIRAKIIKLVVNKPLDFGCQQNHFANCSLISFKKGIKITAL